MTITNMRRYSVRQKLGALVFDLPRLAGTLWSRDRSDREGSWVRYRNRDESLQFAPAGPGVTNGRPWTSDLHLCHVFPSTGLHLMKRSFSKWPIRLAEEPSTGTAPDVTFVIGHRGMERLPNLLFTLRSIAGQQGVSVETIVVEQSATPEIRETLPSWVDYVHTPVAAGTPYSRSWTLNVGARRARGRALVLHDNDIIVPSSYAREILRVIDEGNDFVDLKRFTFYLHRHTSVGMYGAGRVDFAEPPEAVVENLRGASIGASRGAFFEIGGFDESFVGWGAEDNDFWDRAATRRVNAYGYLPMIHSWHAPQPEKTEGNDAPARRRYAAIEKIPPSERIEQLRQRRWGSVDRPDIPNDL